MKQIFILKTIQEDKPGYYDGLHNWSAHIREAQQFDTYPIAEHFLKEMVEINGWGGYFQIEKYFITL